MRTELTLALTDRTQVAALHRWLDAQGVGDPPDPDDEPEAEGRAVAYDWERGVVTVDADRDVTELLKGWAPPPSERERRKARITEATTLAQLKAVLADEIDAGDVRALVGRG